MLPLLFSSSGMLFLFPIVTVLLLFSPQICAYLAWETGVKMVAPEMKLPQIAVLGAGIFVRTQYIPRLREIADIVVLKTIWSRSEESARAAAELARDFSPNIECKWGETGLDEIIHDKSIHGVAVVLAGQTQVDISLKMLKAGKHVVQEKPAASSVSEAETALSFYNSFRTNVPRQPIWAVAENYRFEPAFAESRKLMNEIGDMMSVQVIIEGSMSNSNPYFSSSWRRNFTIVGCEVTTVSAITSHVDLTLPPPDNISAAFQLENGCAGVFVVVVSARSSKTCWRVVGSKGTVQVERGNIDGKHGYSVSFHAADGHCQSSFHPFCGVHEELKAFVRDISQATLADGASFEPDPRSSFIEGARDIAVLEAMLESGAKRGALVHVRKL
ncbi:dehydrogenase FPY6 isoform X2 [Magnolia sinica]|uniref:dehydrogenase FPY6 isoform X2 n=1 Tax=Magnolia sinica TaxID=86752 RepID=UPI002658B377|nr:dehydrogenase FPY6 isoform X2 [Magnolia sinica]